MKRVSISTAAILASIPYLNSEQFSTLKQIDRQPAGLDIFSSKKTKTKPQSRQLRTYYTPDSPEVIDMTRRFWQRAVQLGKANYYCICDNCGDDYQLGKEGDKCQECKSGKLYPQDVEPW